MSIDITVELADTPRKREVGMMWKTHLGNNNGMLFVFPSNAVQSFWMKNTYIGLDIAFISDDGIIFQIERMIPHSTKTTKSSRPCRYALEMNAGWFSKNGVKVGRKIKNLKSSNGVIKFAQSQNQIATNQQDQIPPVDNLQAVQNPTEQAPVDPTNNQGQSSPNQTDPNQQNQNTNANRTILEKIRYANENKLPMTIVYRTENGNTLPPRKLVPDPQKGYEFSRGLSKDLFRAIDVSPTLRIGEMVIEGGHVKSFFIDNIISLEVEEKKGNPVPAQNKTI